MAGQPGCPRGIWYEASRGRWRVKLMVKGELYHRSYHKDYAEALATWRAVKKDITPPRAALTVSQSSVINRFLCQPLIRVGRDSGP